MPGPGRELAEDRRAEHQAARDLADDLGLAQAREQMAAEMGGGEQDDEREEEMGDLSGFERHGSSPFRVRAHACGNHGCPFCSVDDS